MAVRNWEVWVGFTLTFRLSANGCGVDVMVIIEKLWAGFSSSCRDVRSRSMVSDEAIILPLAIIIAVIVLIW